MFTQHLPCESQGNALLHPSPLLWAAMQTLCPGLERPPWTWTVRMAWEQTSHLLNHGPQCCQAHPPSPAVCVSEDKPRAWGRRGMRPAHITFPSRAAKGWAVCWPESEAGADGVVSPVEQDHQRQGKMVTCAPALKSSSQKWQLLPLVFNRQGQVLGPHLTSRARGRIRQPSAWKQKNQNSQWRAIKWGKLLCV